MSVLARLLLLVALITSTATALIVERPQQQSNRAIPTPYFNTEPHIIPQVQKQREVEEPWRVPLVTFAACKSCYVPSRPAKWNGYPHYTGVNKLMLNFTSDRSSLGQLHVNGVPLTIARAGIPAHKMEFLARAVPVEVPDRGAIANAHMYPEVLVTSFSAYATHQEPEMSTGEFCGALDSICTPKRTQYIEFDFQIHELNHKPEMVRSVVLQSVVHSHGPVQIWPGQRLDAIVLDPWEMCDTASFVDSQMARGEVMEQMVTLGIHRKPLWYNGVAAGVDRCNPARYLLVDYPELRNLMRALERLMLQASKSTFDTELASIIGDGLRRVEDGMVIHDHGPYAHPTVQAETPMEYEVHRSHIYGTHVRARGGMGSTLRQLVPSPYWAIINSSNPSPVLYLELFARIAAVLFLICLAARPLRLLCGKLVGLLVIAAVWSVHRSTQWIRYLRDSCHGHGRIRLEGAEGEDSPLNDDNLVVIEKTDASAAGTEEV